MIFQHQTTLRLLFGASQHGTCAVETGSENGGRHRFQGLASPNPGTALRVWMQLKAPTTGASCSDVPPAWHVSRQSTFCWPTEKHQCHRGTRHLSTKPATCRRFKRKRDVLRSMETSTGGLFQHLTSNG